ncbi:helix-turn-helix domain-containing protein [Gordonia terrae]|uniref:XRE family transcriptional regulator n=2 Tax=Gordonia terrae TaxID=2055 RepID=A0AAD0NYE8_9ACTN|nr:helix-turn-helix transcriptional regulator [Gordonia terrae]VTR10243.1 transcriptional regulator [Clostridioides difficile]ANY23311.1 transcriptional regulator [Gordonia terrae]AWO84040.1 XRE family transcriptional regulator [Gordonia terrae]UPW11270.1 helix-turn-helix domain-containing protein [Gordonia terrae]VTS50483.1 anaerobic benzoate catabolism transcriptional regulator [Gordonia terrae]
MAMLLREALGDSLRRVRTQQGRTLREVSTGARVSLGYLSEVERGQKEASSELLAAICDALDVEIADLLLEVGSAMRPAGAEPVVVGAEPMGDTAGVDAADAGLTATKVVIPAPTGRRDATALAAA